MISPYAAAHTVSHVYSEHSSVIKFIDELFGLTPLGELPNEAAAFTAGAALCATNATFCSPTGAAQTTLGPGDVAAGMGDLLEAFDNDRLLGNAAPLPAQLRDDLQPDRAAALRRRRLLDARDHAD